LKSRPDLIGSEGGAEVIEYAIGLAILLVVFLVAGISLDRTGRERADTSMKSSGGMLPYVSSNDRLCVLGSDACK